MKEAKRRTGLLGWVSTRFSAAAGAAATRFPVAAVLIVALSIIANLAVQEMGWASDKTVLRLFAALAGGAAASVAVRLAAEARAASRLLLVLAPAIAALLAALAVWFGEPVALNAPALVSALILLIPLAPFVLRGTPEAFWWFTLWTSLGVALAFLSVILFMSGFAAILEMIRYLFIVGLSSKAYEHIFVTAFALVGPLFALGRIPEVDEPGIASIGEDRLASAVRSLFDWVAAPLALATAVVLHLYAVRIVITGELPRGEVGWIVTFFSILVLALRIAIDPYIVNGAAPTRFFARIWAPALVIPLALLGYAAWLRIAAQGVTLERYFLVLGGIAAGLSVGLQLLPRTRGDIRVLSAVPVVLLAFSVVGPWGAASVVGRSQAERIKGIVAALPGGDIEKSGEETKQELRSRIGALDDVDQLGRLVPIVPSGRREAVTTALAENPIERPVDQTGRYGVLAALGLSSDYIYDAATRSFSASATSELLLDGYDRGLTSRWVYEPGASPGLNEPVSLRFDGDDLVVRYTLGEDRFALGPSIRNLPDTNSYAGTKQIEAPVFDLVSASGKTVRVRVESITLAGEKLRPQTGVLTVLLRDSDWRVGSFGGNR